jgi:hypothetical protein
VVILKEKESVIAPLSFRRGVGGEALRGAKSECPIRKKKDVINTYGEWTAMLIYVPMLLCGEVFEDFL